MTIYLTNDKDMYNSLGVTSFCCWCRHSCI